MFDETIRQSTDDGIPFPKLLKDSGVIPGIKVDTGAKPLALYAGETVTEGLDALRERLAEYRELDARFAKWRATIYIDEARGLPTECSLRVNAHALARYAALCQETEIVPIVEPETLMDGNHHIDACERATDQTLRALYEELAQARIDLPGTLLKVNMVLCGKGCPDQASHEEIANRTIETLRRTVPEPVPGIVFLSGGMSDEDATIRLNEMNKLGPQPWEVSFSYGRALQAPSLKVWRGDPANVEAGQRALAHRVRMNGLARSGDYSESSESAA
ncbi:MAG: class I fructose-bisphosphate aldolase [Actinomycetota bacterium]